MASHNEDQLRAIWKGQAIVTLQLTPDQLRARAEKFELSIRRRNARDYVCFALVAAWSVGAPFFLHGMLTRIGAVLIGLWAFVSVYWLFRHGSAIRIADTDTQSRVAYHQKQLERQRDIVLSWPWGLGLLLPGYVLFSLGMTIESAHPDWTKSIAMIGVGLFFYIAVVIDGQIRAAEWQREIDALGLLGRDQT